MNGSNNQNSSSKIKSPTSNERYADYSTSYTIQHSTVSPIGSLNNINSKLSPRQNDTAIKHANKCESVSSNEKDAEYLRVILPYKSQNTNDLTVCYNEIVKLIEDDADFKDYDNSWIKVFNSQGIIGMIPSSCVEPLLEDQLNNFVFIRRPTCVGLFSNYEWYFGNISRFETILLLNKYGRNGDFLIRDSDVS